jgi:hypothetical protein
MPIGGDQAGGGDEVDQLVDAGLAKYGQGDVDGALRAWEQALRMDPAEIRAAAYVDYVRENYEMLAGAPRGGEIAVPFGLGAVPGDGATDSDSDSDDYEVEITGFPGALDEPPEQEPSALTVERYIESVDEGWFLDGEVPPTFASRGAPGMPPIDLELDPPQRPSSPRQLPLPANPGVPDDAVTMEMEAEDPEGDEPRAPAVEGDRPRRFTPAVVTQVPAAPPPAAEEVDERTNDFNRAGPWPRAGEMDFADLRTAAPTQEIAAPRGFIRTARMVPLHARGEETGETGESRGGGDTQDTGGFDTEDDKLLTRPGRTIGSPLDVSDMPLGVAPDVLAALTSPGTMTPSAGIRALGPTIGPEESTRESPFVRVTFNPDTQDLPVPPPQEPAGDDDERTSERGAIRLDTASELTTERRAYRPEPIDGPRTTSGVHPPLVIIEDPLLARTRTEDRREGDLLDSVDGAEPVSLEFGEPGAEPPPTAESRRRRNSTMPNRAPTVDPMLDAASKVRSRRSSSMAPPTAALLPADEISIRLDAEVEARAPANESRPDRSRRRVCDLIERALAASNRGDHAVAIVALDLALAEDPESAVAQKLVHRHAPAILDCYQRYLGDLGNRPGLAMPMHELHGEKLDIRAAFLLSRVDGALSFEEILDVSGMQRAEAFRHLSNLVLRGILTVG